MREGTLVVVTGVGVVQIVVGRSTEVGMDVAINHHGTEIVMTDLEMECCVEQGSLVQLLVNYSN